MVQARWGHLNAAQNLLTRLSATLLDGHFVLEHTARHRSGRFFNFNGTAGVWRRTCIDEAGGWQHDTITEDLDISYRAQLKGWKFVFLKDLVIPAEVPDHMRAFKSQQFRWAKAPFKRLENSSDDLESATPGDETATVHLTLIRLSPHPHLALLMPMTALIRGMQWMQWALFIDVIAFCVTRFRQCLLLARTSSIRLRQAPSILKSPLFAQDGISINQSREFKAFSKRHHLCSHPVR